MFDRNLHIHQEITKVSERNVDKVLFTCPTLERQWTRPTKMVCDAQEQKNMDGD